MRNKEELKDIIKKFFKFENFGCACLLLIFIIIPAISLFGWHSIILILYILEFYVIGFIQGYDNKLK